MVAIEEVEEAKPAASQERLWDAEEIEKLIPQLERPTARMQIESLVKKLKKESSALKAIEETTPSSSSEASTEKKEETTKKQPPAPPAPAPPPPPAPIAIPLSTSAATSTSSSVTYTSLDKFAFDAGGSSDKFVTLYLPLPEVGSKIPKDERKDRIRSVFTKDGFDVTVMDLNGKNYRVKRDNLEHDIDPDSSKHVIKADKIIVKLAKVKGEYGSYDYWSKLTDPKKSEKKKSGSGGSGKSEDPSASIMSMMKDMYDSGDDNMRKMIGETMLKQRNGELGRDRDNLGGLGGKDGGLGDGLDDF